MCLLAIFVRVAEHAPLIVAANREEFYARGGEPPSVQAGEPRFVAGIDPLHGGTWLGVNAGRVLVAITNRGKTRPPAQPKSRGLLVRDLLHCSTAAEATEHAVAELDGGQYAGCNLLCADRERALVVHSGDWLRVRPLPAGIHVMANADIDDEADARVAYARRQLAACDFRRAEDCVNGSRSLLSLTEPEPTPICFRHTERGTVSASIIVLHQAPAHSMYWHAQGPPDRTPFADLSPLLREIGL